MGNDLQVGKVARRSLDPNGNTYGTYNDNPFLNTITYDVEFPDGQIRENSANIITENMLMQVDSDGHHITLMDGILDHQSNHRKAIPKPDGHIITKSGLRRLR